MRVSCRSIRRLHRSTRHLLPLYHLAGLATSDRLSSYWRISWKIHGAARQKRGNVCALRLDQFCAGRCLGCLLQIQESRNEVLQMSAGTSVDDGKQRIGDFTGWVELSSVNSGVS